MPVALIPIARVYPNVPIIMVYPYSAQSRIVTYEMFI